MRTIIDYPWLIFGLSFQPLLPVLPLVVAISFLLIADIDSPRGGLIRVSPQNLTSLAGSLRAPDAKL